MELKLTNKSFEYMGAVFRSGFTHEVTAEAIIPDSLPDAQRIIGTEAMVYIRNKEPESGRLTVGGMADVSVIYADDEGRIRRSQISRQFGTSVDNSNIDSDTRAVVEMRVASADARLLNPRKMLVRCDVLLDVECYEPRRVEMYLPPEDGAHPVEMLTEEREAMLVTDVAERTFSVTSEYSFPSGKPPVGEVLCASVSLETEETVPAGGKAMLRGIARARIIYRPERGGMPETAEFSQEFSQILEPGGDGTEFRTSVVPTAAYFGTDSLFDSDDRRVTLEISALAQCLAMRKEKVECIADAYSCVCGVSFETGETVIDPAGDENTVGASVREVIEMSRQPAEILSVSAKPGVVYLSGRELRTTVTADVMYMSEDGVLLSVSKKVPATCELSFDPRGDTFASARIREEPLAVIVRNGAEVRMNVEFDLRTSAPLTISGLTAVSADTESPRDLTGRPSLVLKRFGDGDTMWSLAKKYGSLRALIADANGLGENEEPAPGTMLIIPKKR